jgi:hypothetical protein
VEALQREDLEDVECAAGEERFLLASRKQKVPVLCGGVRR